MIKTMGSIIAKDNNLLMCNMAHGEVAKVVDNYMESKYFGSIYVCLQYYVDTIFLCILSDNSELVGSTLSERSELEVVMLDHNEYVDVRFNNLT